MAFEKLNLPFVPLRASQRIKSAQITALADCRICFPRVEAVAAGFEFTDHKFLQRDILIRARLVRGDGKPGMTLGTGGLVRRDGTFCGSFTLRYGVSVTRNRAR